MISTLAFQIVIGRSWRGSVFGGYKSRDQIPELARDVQEGKLNVDDLLTHQMPLEKINEAFDLMHEGKRYVFCVDIVVCVKILLQVDFGVLLPPLYRPASTCLYLICLFCLSLAFAP